jgi:hypothetical protein
VKLKLKPGVSDSFTNAFNGGSYTPWLRMYNPPTSDSCRWLISADHPESVEIFEAVYRANVGPLITQYYLKADNFPLEIDPRDFPLGFDYRFRMKCGVPPVTFRLRFAPFGVEVDPP